MVELPYVFLQAAVYVVIVFSLMGFEWTTVKFFWYLFFMYFTLLYFTLWNMEPFFRIPDPTNCEYLPHLILIIYFCLSVSQLQTYTPITKLFSFFLFISFVFLIKNRGSLYGGDGTIGHVQWLGPCTDW